jgi:hypothetical protein
MKMNQHSNEFSEMFNRVEMYGWWTKKTGTKMTTIQIEIWQICTV